MNVEYDTLPFEIKNIKDLIELSKLYDKEKPHQYGINMNRLKFISSTLEKINKIIGMNNVKETVFNKIITYLQNLGNINDMEHLVIQAPPGYGKTMIASYISEIYYKLGIIKGESSDNKKYIHPISGEEIDFPFVVAKRSDLVGEYVGHTAPKVENIIKQALGGVLVIDEAYSLGGNDTFSTECINTLNQMLSEYSGKFICIIAGYKEELNRSFFTNPGLRRRFRFVLDIQEYSPLELSKIFTKMTLDTNWNIKTSKSFLSEFIKLNKNVFKYSAGDMETLLQTCKITHSKRVLGIHPKEKKILNEEDIENGFKLFLMNRDNSEIISERIIETLYM